jgi:hypothetical protein
VTDNNGRVKLSWGQIVWGIATLAAVLGSWYDTRNQIALVRAELQIRVESAELENTRIWDAIRDAYAAPRRKP